MGGTRQTGRAVQTAPVIAARGEGERGEFLGVRKTSFSLYRKMTPFRCGRHTLSQDGTGIDLITMALQWKRRGLGVRECGRPAPVASLKATGNSWHGQEDGHPVFNPAWVDIYMGAVPQPHSRSTARDRTEGAHPNISRAEESEAPP